MNDNWRLLRDQKGLYIDLGDGSTLRVNGPQANNLDLYILIMAASAMQQALTKLANFPARVRFQDGTWTKTGEETLAAARRYASYILDSLK